MPADTTPTERLLLTADEAFELLHIKKTLGWKLIREGAIPSIKVGRLVRVPRRELEAWITAQAAGESGDLPRLRAVS
jgi:excisionase family DNA binding protein